ncbi:MAG: hypothetical protein HC819_24955 [Cyclobacteriaceae bacterium]|nr:hypothetical protein [Cyclobacteriaceae bacterium]
MVTLRTTDCICLLADGNQDIYIYNLNTNETTNITNTPNRQEDYPAWSPDGRKIAFERMDFSTGT